MGGYIDAIITGLVTAAICGIVICCLVIRQKRDRQKWKRIAEDNYSKGKDAGSDVLRATCDKIEDDRKQLAEQSEKDLLIEIMLALSSCGRRMDRMDDKLRVITNYRSYLDDIHDKTQKLTQGFVVLDSDISKTSSVINGLRKAIQDTGTEIHTLISELSGLGELHQAISGHVSKLNNVELTLEYLQDKVAFIVEEMKTVMTAHDQSPMKKLESIDMEITGLSLLVNAIHDDVAEISTASGTIEKQLRESLEEGGDNRISSQLDALSETMGSVDREVENMCTKLNDIHDCLQHQSGTVRENRTAP